MTDGERNPNAPPGPRKAGERLRAAREARGLSLDDVALRTRIPRRHLEAMEASDYAGLPSPTYAVGFARAYARAVGADDVGIARDVRSEAAQNPRRTIDYEPYVTADPARIPSRALVIVTAGVAVAVLILAALWFGSALVRRKEGTPAPAATSTAVPPPARPAAPRGGQVTLSALGEVWLRVSDTTDKTLFLGVMKQGQTFAVPADARGPRVTVGRPDQLRIALNGSPIPPLGDGKRPVKDVAVDPAAIAARLSAAPTPTPTPAPAASPSGRPSPTRSPSPDRRPARPARANDSGEGASDDRTVAPAPAPEASPAP